MVGLVPAEKDVIPMVLSTSTSAGPSSAFRLANSSAIGLSLVCRASVVGLLGLLSGVLKVGCKAVFHAVVAFAKERGKNTDGYQQCGYSVLKQRIPKLYRERWNLHAAPPRALSGDVTGGSRGPTTFMATCSSIVMVTYVIPCDLVSDQVLKHFL